ncbi:MAG: hypothetical protein LBL95_09855 [Deltaproteobacteria bacterium]|jgi:hypothetical protein|nr:hypothetical protein [Deltaproteobacteria bacterium]
MPLLLIVGGFLVLGGLALLIVWLNEFLLVFKAFFPLLVISLGGLLAYFGWEERKDSQRAFLDFSSPDEASRYQAEALAYQEKIDSLGGRRSQESPDGVPDGQGPLAGPPGEAEDDERANLGKTPG